MKCVHATAAVLAAYKYQFSSNLLRELQAFAKDGAMPGDTTYSAQWIGDACGWNPRTVIEFLLDCCGDDGLLVINALWKNVNKPLPRSPCDIADGLYKEYELRDIVNPPLWQVMLLKNAEARGIYADVVTGYTWDKVKKDIERAISEHDEWLRYQ